MVMSMENQNKVKQIELLATEVSYLDVYVNNDGLVCVDAKFVDERKILKTNCSDLLDVFFRYEINGWFDRDDLEEIKRKISEHFERDETIL